MISLTPTTLAIGGGVAAVLGYLAYSVLKRKPAPPPRVVPAPKKAAGGGGGGGGAKASSATTDWKLTGYRAGLATGKADRQAKRSFGASFRRSESPPSSVPAGTDAGTKLTLRQLWSLGWIEGYPVGYGTDATGKVAAAPRYALDAYSAEEWDAVEAEEEGGGSATAADAAEEVDYAEGAVEEKLGDWLGGGSSVETSGSPSGVVARVGAILFPYNEGYHDRRPDGTWGPRQVVLLHARRGVVPLRRTS